MHAACVDSFVCVPVPRCLSPIASPPPSCFEYDILSFPVSVCRTYACSTSLPCRPRSSALTRRRPRPSPRAAALTISTLVRCRLQCYCLHYQGESLHSYLLLFCFLRRVAMTSSLRQFIIIIFCALCTLLSFKRYLVCWKLPLDLGGCCVPVCVCV